MVNIGEQWIPSGKRLHNYGKSHFLWANQLEMAMFNSFFVCLPEGNNG